MLNMDATDTHYDRLAVSRDAPPEVIRAAYKALTQKYHPDKNPGDSEAARVMTLLNQSYDVLMDPVRRAEHDAWIDAQEGAGDVPPITDADEGVHRHEDFSAGLLGLLGLLAGKISTRNALLLAFGGVLVISAVVGGILAKAQEKEDAMEAKWAAHVRNGRAAAAAAAPASGFALPMEKSVAIRERPVVAAPAAPEEPAPLAQKTPKFEEGAPLALAGSNLESLPDADSKRNTSATVSPEEERTEQANREPAVPSDKRDAAADRTPRKEKSTACAEWSGDDAFPTESYSGYLPGQPVLNANGRSTFTVDNMQVEEDVLVKLVDTDNRTAVRSFQVRANSSFTAEQLDRGNYKVLYRPRKPDCEWHAFGKVFDIREEEGGGGAGPTDVTVTLPATR